jgi:hypothetical protein
MIIFTIFGQSTLAAELGLVYSIISFFNLVFSYNVKNLILLDNNLNFAKKTFIFRFFLAIFSLIIFFFFKHLMFFNSDNLMFLTTLIITQSWLIEIALITYEIKKKYNFFYIYSLFYIFFYFAILLNLIIYNNYYFSHILVIISLINFFLILSFNFNNYNEIKNVVKKKIFNFENNLAFYSSFSIILSIVIWRFFIYYNFEKSIAGILFSAFAIGSFSGTIFFNSISPTFINQNIKITKYLNIYSIFILCLIFILSFIFFNKNLIGLNLNEDNLLFFKCTIISILGSPLILFSIKNRISFYKIEKYRFKIHILDIFSSIFISMIPVFLFYIEKNLVIYSYFLSSIVMSIIFSKLFFK